MGAMWYFKSSEFVLTNKIPPKAFNSLLLFLSDLNTVTLRLCLVISVDLIYSPHSVRETVAQNLKTSMNFLSTRELFQAVR